MKKKRKEKVHEEMASMKEDIKSVKLGSSCEGNTAASKRYGLGSGTFARRPPPGPNWRENWMPKKIDIKRLVKDWSMKEMTGFNDQHVMKLMTEFEGSLRKEAKYFTDCTYG